MKRMIVIVALSVLMLTSVQASEHYRVDAGVIMKVSTLAGTPSTQMAKQLTVMYMARPGLWLGMQVCPTEEGDEVGGPKAQLRLGTLHTTKAGTLYDLGAYGYWDVNGSGVDGAFDLQQGSLGLSLSLMPVGAKWTLMVFGGADGYTEFIETLVEIRDGDEKTDPEFETVITSEGAQAFELGFSMGFSF